VHRSHPFTNTHPHMQDSYDSDLYNAVSAARTVPNAEIAEVACVSGPDDVKTVYTNFDGPGGYVQLADVRGPCCTDYNQSQNGTATPPPSASTHPPTCSALGSLTT